MIDHPYTKCHHPGCAEPVIVGWRPETHPDEVWPLCYHHLRLADPETAASFKIVKGGKRRGGRVNDGRASHT